MDERRDQQTAFWMASLALMIVVEDSEEIELGERENPLGWRCAFAEDESEWEF